MAINPYQPSEKAELGHVQVKGHNDAIRVATLVVLLLFG